MAAPMIELAQWAGVGGVGLSTGLFVLWLRSAAPKRDPDSGEQSSLVRQRNRRQAIAQSMGFRMMLPLVLAFDPIAKRVVPESTQQSVRKWYTPAGCPGGLSDTELVSLAFVISMMLAFCFAYVGVLMAGPIGILPAIGGMFLGPLLVSSSLESRAKTRQAMFNRSLPYALDLLVLTLRAGTSLKLSLARVVGDYDGHPIGDEFGQALAEIQLGLPRADALRRLATRVADDEARSLVDAINQAEELGWPLADTVERLADRLNETRTLNAQETAGKAAVKVMLPSTMVLMAAIILLFGPTIVRYFRGEYAM